MEWSQNKDKALQERYKAGDYVVPKKPDQNAIDKLVISMVETALGLGLK